MFKSTSISSATPTDKLFLPRFCDVRTVLIMVILTEFFAVVWVLMPLTRMTHSWDYLQQQFWYELALTSLAMQWIALSCTSLLCLTYRGFEQLRSDALATIIAYIFVLSVTVLVSEVAWQIERSIVSSQTLALQLQHTVVLWYSGIATLVGAVGVVGLMWQYPTQRPLWLLLGISFVLLVFLASSLLVMSGIIILPNQTTPRTIIQDDIYLLFMLRNSIISSILATVMLRYFYMRHQWKRNTLAVAEAKIQALQARIRPHFLFNSLNSIASLIHIDPDTAEIAVEDLAGLFRASLADGRSLIPFEEEMNLCLQYLRIEALRLEERLELQWDIEVIPQNAMVPPLCLQPLLENAIYYGIQPRLEGGKISVLAEREKKWLKLWVISPLNTPTKDENSLQPTQQHKGNRIAQTNIQQRLVAHFGRPAGLYIEPTADHYRVYLRFPYLPQSES